VPGSVGSTSESLGKESIFLVDMRRREKRPVGVKFSEEPNSTEVDNTLPRHGRQHNENVFKLLGTCCWQADAQYMRINPLRRERLTIGAPQFSDLVMLCRSEQVASDVMRIVDQKSVDGRYDSIRL
jgi:hypothetical protein